MALSEWPEHFKDGEAGRDYVTVCFEDDLFVKTVTLKAIGLSEEEDGEIVHWFPLSQLEDVPDKGAWINRITIPRWLARERDLD